MNKPIIFSDLDDTLISSARKITDVPAKVASVDKNGQASNYFSKEQWAFFTHLNQLGRVIPVTARSSSNVLKQLRVKFEHEMVTTHGAKILDANLIADKAFSGIIASQLREIESSIVQTFNRVKQTICPSTLISREWAKKTDFKCSIITEYQLPCYISLRLTVPSQEHILSDIRKELKKSIDLDMFYIVVSGNSLHVIPHFVSKQTACQYLIDKHYAQSLIICCGDSLSDYPFLSLGHVFISPTKSQIAQSLFSMSQVLK